MSDVVVTLPINFRWEGAPDMVGLEAWLAEGDAPGTAPSGIEYAWTVGGRPRIEPGERVYVVHAGRLIGYAPLVRVERVGHHYHGGGRWALIRAGGAVSVTINETIRGVPGFRYRWWDRGDEIPLDLCTIARRLGKEPQ